MTDHTLKDVYAEARWIVTELGRLRRDNALLLAIRVAALLVKNAPGQDVWADVYAHEALDKALADWDNREGA